MSETLTIEQLKTALSKTWNKETSNTPDKWRKNKPSTGQCAITALIVNDYFGGIIIRGEFSNKESHYWNLVGEDVVDLTRDQYKEEISFETLGKRSRDYILKDKSSKKRYEKLKALLMETLNSSTTNEGQEEIKT